MDKISQRQQAAFAAMIPEMVVSQTSNPCSLGSARDRRYVGHPSGWRFVVTTGCFGPIVLAAAPKHQLSAAAHLVEGAVEMHVRELLEQM
jgi:hypothetical protein